MEKKFNISLVVFLVLILTILSSQKTQIKFRDNVLFFKDFLFTKNVTTKNISMSDTVGFKETYPLILDEIKNQSCFFSFQDDGFMQIYLEMNYCTTIPINQYVRTNRQQLLSIKELNNKKPNLILFDIDFPEKYYSEGIRVEGDVRASVYNNKILNFLIDNYAPYKNINGFFFWKYNNKKFTKEISINKNFEKIINNTPRNLCEKIDDLKNNCFIKVTNKKNGIVIDVIYGNYNHKTIREIIDIENKLYYNKKNPLKEKFNNFEENFDNLEITLLSDNINYLIKSNY